jgi:hypothetical protein
MDQNVSAAPTGAGVGVGAVPVGVGATAIESRPGVGGSIRFVQPTPAKTWKIAYALGDKAPRIKLAGSGFSYAKMLQGFIATRMKSLYFVFTGTGGAFLFACVYQGGVPVIKLATSGLQQVGVGKAPGTGQPVGVGQPAPLSVAGVIPAPGYLSPIPGAPPSCPQWKDPGLLMNSATISALITILGGAWSALGGTTGTWNGVQFTRYNGAYHFLYNSPTGGATLGEPNGIIYCKFDGSNLSICGGPVGSSQVTAPPTITTPPVSSGNPVEVKGPVAPTSSDQGTYQWDTYMWQYVAAGQGDVPTQPPPTTPGALGLWVNTRNDLILYDWYPFGVQGLATITDPSGNIWYVYCSGYGANGEGASADYNPPAVGSVIPPAALAGTTGSWSTTIHPYYQVWIPAASTMSTAELLLLLALGVAAVGGVAYYATTP